MAVPQDEYGGPMMPRPPLIHRLLAARFSMSLYRLLGRPPITYSRANITTKMSAGPGNVVQVQTSKTMR